MAEKLIYEANSLSDKIEKLNRAEIIPTYYKDYFIWAQKLYAAGLSIYRRHVSKEYNQMIIIKEDEILDCMIKIEKLAVEKILHGEYKKDKTKVASEYKKYQIKITELRENTAEKIKMLDPMQETDSNEEIIKNNVELLYEENTSTIKEIFNSIINDCIDMYPMSNKYCMPNKDWEFVFIGLGSMGRGEMTPYSDIEFAVLIDDKEDEETRKKQKKYFKNITKLIQLRIIALGETAFSEEEMQKVELIKAGELTSIRLNINKFLKEKHVSKKKLIK